VSTLDQPPVFEAGLFGGALGIRRTIERLIVRD
jgi:hypothetical protein